MSNSSFFGSLLCIMMSGQLMASNYAQECKALVNEIDEGITHRALRMGEKDTKGQYKHWTALGKVKDRAKLNKMVRDFYVKKFRSELVSKEDIDARLKEEIEYLDDLYKTGLTRHVRSIIGGSASLECKNALESMRSTFFDTKERIVFGSNLIDCPEDNKDVDFVFIKSNENKCIRLEKAAAMQSQTIKDAVEAGGNRSPILLSTTGNRLLREIGALLERIPHWAKMGKKPGGYKIPFQEMYKTRPWMKPDEIFRVRQHTTDPKDIRRVRQIPMLASPKKFHGVMASEEIMIEFNLNELALGNMEHLVGILNEASYLNIEGIIKVGLDLLAERVFFEELKWIDEAVYKSEEKRIQSPLQIDTPSFLTSLNKDLQKQLIEHSRLNSLLVKPKSILSFTRGGKNKYFHPWKEIDLAQLENPLLEAQLIFYARMLYLNGHQRLPPDLTDKLSLYARRYLINSDWSTFTKN